MTGGQVHACTQDERIRDLCKRVDKLEVSSDTMKLDIQDIKSVQQKILMGVIGMLFTSVGTLVLIIFKLKGVG